MYEYVQTAAGWVLYWGGETLYRGGVTRPEVALVHGDPGDVNEAKGDGELEPLQVSCS